ncbi:DNA polymerase III subunit delta' C-terminal domain-containing protein, partial [Francisella tularensis]|uniref:DNA polymerase III subunit delta' C-terminal domain-containing protein n=1 Tax=Francisella tularensis TaxID=263 RepID=UPI0019943D81
LNVFLKEANPPFKDNLYLLNSMIIDFYCYKLDEHNQGIANYDKQALIKYLEPKLDTDFINKMYFKALTSQKYFVTFKNVEQ